nr:reverse transcriptase domain-containing protein [Tanacetum cinerariifolium]
NKQFYGHDKEDPHAHIRYFNKITSTLKFPNVPNTSIKLMLFPFSLEGAARIWLEKEPPRSIFTWDDLVSKFINQFFPPSKTTSIYNEITNFQQRFDESFSEAWDRFKDLLQPYPHHGFLELHQLDTFYNALNSKDQDSLNFAAGATSGETPKVEASNVQRNNQNRFIPNQNQGNNFNQGSVYLPLVFQPPAYQAPAYQAPAPQTQGTLPSNMIANPKSDLKAITTRSGVSYDGPEATKDTMNPTNNKNTKDVQPQAVQFESLVSTSKPVTSPISEPTIALVSASTPNPKALIPYSSRRNDERNREKANNQIDKFY